MVVQPPVMEIKHQRMPTDIKFNTVLAEYQDRMLDENERMTSLSVSERIERRDEFLLSVGEEAAIFMNLLVKSSKAKSVLEIGTSYGYSTLWLAEAAKVNGGKVITLENNIDKVIYAKDKIAKAGLSKYVDFRTGDAIDSIKKAKETFDFILVDIWKKLYVDCLDAFYPKLNDGAWVLGDNMIFPPTTKNETQAYQKKIRELGTFESILVPFGSGIELSQHHSKS